MKRKNGPVTALWDIYKYNQQKYSLLYVLLFLGVIFEVVGISANFSITDLLYFLFAFIFFIKKMRIKYVGNLFGSEYLFLFAFILLAFISYSNYGFGRMFQSELRFLYNCGIFTVIFSYFKGCNSIEREKLVSSYLYVCVLASTFIFIQYISFYIFRYTIKFDIGDFNAASLYTYSSSAIYRTGGLFNEPSWFTLFVGPSLEIAYKNKKFKELIVCVLGLILSTSSMAFLFLFIFGITKFSFKRGNMKTILLMIVALFLVYICFPQAFARLFEALDFENGTNSNDARVLDPFAFVASISLPIFGMDVSDIIGDTLFLNTFVFVLLAFGVVGLIIFLLMILQRKSLCLSLLLLLTVIIEGCYGRIDFWMALLASSVFCYCLKENERINMKLS